LKSPCVQGTQRPAFFMQHGLEDSSATWVMNLPDKAAGFIFADAGYDVWLGNFRGNTYSINSTKYNTTQTQFWQFSWDEMAHYDLPAQIDYVRNYTNQTKIYYMGHSMGTMTMFARAILDTTWKDKFLYFFALAPVTSTHHIKGMLSYLAPFISEVQWIAKEIGLNEFLPSDELMKIIAKYVCGALSTNPVCDSILFALVGPNTDNLNTTRLPVYLAHTPAGTSTQNIVHFAQGVNHQPFAMYDYGAAGNVDHYNQVTPPIYNLNTCNLPTYYFAGDQDWLADPADVQWAYNQMFTNVVCQYKLNGYNHMDFIWGQKTVDDVYGRILSIIAQNGKCVP
jgi:lysosomal acid lipase/cholesteryl ester hydrolase